MCQLTFLNVGVFSIFLLASDFVNCEKSGINIIHWAFENFVSIVMVKLCLKFEKIIHSYLIKFTVFFSFYVAFKAVTNFLRIIDKLQILPAYTVLMVF